MRSYIIIRMISFVSLLTISCVLFAKEEADTRAEFIRSHYIKYEYQIPMRDGVKLFTSVYLPSDNTEKYPMMMMRTPYRVAPYGANKYKSEYFTSVHIRSRF